MSCWYDNFWLLSAESYRSVLVLYHMILSWSLTCSQLVKCPRLKSLVFFYRTMRLADFFPLKFLCCFVTKFSCWTSFRSQLKAGKISEKPYTLLSRLPFGQRLCSKIVWGCTEIFSTFTWSCLLQRLGKCSAKWLNFSSRELGQRRVTLCRRGVYLNRCWQTRWSSK